MSTPFDGSKDQFRITPQKKDDPMEDADAVRKAIRDRERLLNAAGERPLRLGEWIEGNVD